MAPAVWQSGNMAGCALRFKSSWEAFTKFVPLSLGRQLNVIASQIFLDAGFFVDRFRLASRRRTDLFLRLSPLLTPFDARSVPVSPSCLSSTSAPGAHVQYVSCIVHSRATRWLVKWPRTLAKGQANNSFFPSAHHHHCTFFTILPRHLSPW